MQVVIELTDEMYANVQAEVERSIHPSRDARWTRLLLAIGNGEVLPKGHGRLIDADKLKSCTKYYAPRGFEGLLMRYADLRNAPTIVEADEEVDE